MTAMDERNRAEQELLQLREKLKEKIDTEEAYKKNLRSALDKYSDKPSEPPRTKSLLR